jgi:osmotically-inducible protein OsmY
MHSRPDPELVHILQDIPHLYYNEALRLAKDRDPAGARDRLLAALALNPEMIDALVVLGKVNAQSGRYDEAITNWKRVLELQPENEAAQSALTAARRIMKATKRKQQTRTLMTGGIAVALLFIAAVALKGYQYAVRQPAPTPAPASAQAAMDASTPYGKTVTVVRVDNEAASFTKFLSNLRDDRFASISVVEISGTISITGSLDSQDDLNRLKGMAGSFPGVRAVEASSVEIKPPPEEDALQRATRQIRDKLQAAFQLHESKCDVQSKDGGIRVVGTVETEEKKQLVSFLAKENGFGAQIDCSGLTVLNPPASAESVKSILDELDNDFKTVTVGRKDGTLHFSGSLPYQYQKDQLERIARAFPGVKEVELEDLRVLGAKDYTVKSGDTLWRIAQKFYSNGETWPSIMKANPHLPRDFRQIRTGTRLRILPIDSLEIQSGKTQTKPD